MCKCKTMSEKLLGDGCDECNPEMAMQITIDNLEDEIAELKSEKKAAHRLIDLDTKKLEELDAHIERLREAKTCRCGDAGFFVVANNYTGEPEQEQCEFCYTHSDSRFNALNETPNQSLAHIKQDAIREMLVAMKEVSSGVGYGIVIHISDIEEYVNNLEKE